MLTAVELLAIAEQDRYALIFDDKYEEDIEQNLRELYQLYPCTGILVRQSVGGQAYHLTGISNVASIEKEGILPSTDEDLEYGDGVIYTFPRLDCYTKIDPATAAVYRITYGPGTLRAVATFDRDEREQGEVLIFPECVLSVERVMIQGNPGAVKRMQLG